MCVYYDNIWIIYQYDKISSTSYQVSLPEVIVWTLINQPLIIKRLLISLKAFECVSIFHTWFLFLMSDRNLSSAKQSNRQTMRKCPGLIDSLVRYLKDSVEAGKPDNKVPGWLGCSDALRVHSPLSCLVTPSWERGPKKISNIWAISCGVWPFSQSAFSGREEE